MRRHLAWICCAAYLAFSFVAGTAHVHGGGDSHDEARGLHLDHAHLGHGTDHGHDRPPPNARFEPSVSGLAGGHVAHHHGDALPLNVMAQRPSHSALRGMPAMVVTTVTVDEPSCVPLRGDESSGPLRGPPGRVPVPARAPPA